jgi:hypothetical protein
MWAEKVVQAALDVLSPRDLMGVLYYSWSDGVAWLFPLAEVGNKVSMTNAIKGIQPGDMPSFDPTLQMAYDALSVSSAAVKHIVIISDGDPATPNQALAQKIKNAGITISTVCIAPHSPRDSAVMQNLAKWGGGNFYQPTQFDKLPQIFIKEAATVRKSLIFEDPFTPVIRGYSPLLPGIGEAYPQLRGYVGSTPKSLADVPLVTENDDPLLAHWQHGVGKTAAFTSDAKERWANAWLGWEKYSKFWSQIVRWSLRQGFNRNYQVETIVEGSEGKIIVDAVDDNGEFRNFLNLQGRIVSPELDAQPIHFRQTSPGRYEATFEAGDPGTYMFSAQSMAEGGESMDLVTGGASLSYSPEFQTPKSNEALLYRLVDITGGRVLEETTPVFLHNLDSRAEPRPLWPALLTAALFVFLADVFSRRVLVGWREIRDGAAWAWTRLRDRYGWRRMATAETAPGRLLKIKESVRSTDAEEVARREEFLASIQRAKIEPRVAVDLQSKKTPAMPTDEKKKTDISEPAEESGGHTSQLLRARREAQRKFRK